MKNSSYLPAAAIQLGNGQCRQGEVVGQEYQAPVVVLVEEPDPGKLLRVVLACIEILRSDDLLALQPSCLVHRERIEAPEPEIVLGPDDEEGPGLMNRVKPGEIDISSIHDVDGPCLYHELIEDVHLVHFAMGDNHHRGKASLQIQKSMELDRSLVLPELSPGKERQAEIDDCGVQCIHRLVQFHAEGFAGVEPPCLLYEDLGEVGIDPPVPNLIGIGQGVPLDLAQYAQVIQLCLHRSQACLYISQAFPIGQLGKGHAEKLVPAGEALDLVVAVVSSYTLAEIVNRYEVHQLGEHGTTGVHQPPPSAGMQKYGLLRKIFSNRLQQFLPGNLLHSLIYSRPPVKRWDSSDPPF